MITYQVFDGWKRYELNPMNPRDEERIENVERSPGFDALCERAEARGYAEGRIEGCQVIVFCDD